MSAVGLAFACTVACTLTACFWDFSENSTAGGCVDDLGTSHPGTEPTACGRGGGLCSVCSGTLSTCLDGACVPEHAPVSIHAGAALSCAIDREGAVYCWGASRFLLLGFMGESATPVPIALPEPVAYVSSGGEYSTTACARTETGRLFCWGDNGEGQCGNGLFVNPLYPPEEVAGEGTWTDVSVGTFHAMGIRDGRLHGWGDNAGGENGLPPGTSDIVPTAIGDEATWLRVSTNVAHGCGIRDFADGSGSLYCWGDNEFGQRGTGMAGDPAPNGPVPTATPTGWSDISVGQDHSCGLRAGGRLFCWGDGADGRLGTDAAMLTEPTEVAASIAPFTKVTLGDLHTCALTPAGAVWCFGTNANGQLGLDGGTLSSAVPIRVLAEHEVIDVDAGGWHTCAITRERRIFCWGSNGESESGDPTDRNSFHPTPQEVVITD